MIKRSIDVDTFYVPTTTVTGIYNGPIDTYIVNTSFKVSGGLFELNDSMPGYEMIPCPDGRPGCCVAHYRKRIDPEQIRREELIENEISGIFE